MHTNPTNQIGEKCIQTFQGGTGKNEWFIKPLVFKSSQSQMPKLGFGSKEKLMLVTPGMNYDDDDDAAPKATKVA